MKYLFTLCFLVSLSASAQKFALIDKNAKLPMLFTDSVSVQQVSQGYFPVAVEGIDTFYANLKYLVSVLNERQRSKMESFELRNGSTVIKVKRVPFAYGDRYTARATTAAGAVQGSSLLIDFNNQNKKSATALVKLLGYMASNKDLFRGANEITPQLYSQFVITDK